MGNSCPAPARVERVEEEECDRDCDDGEEMHSNPNCQLQLCPECDDSIRMTLDNADCEYLLQPDKHPRNACLQYDLNKHNKEYNMALCKTREDYERLETRVENALVVENQFLDDIRNIQQVREAALDAALTRAQGNIQSAQNRRDQKKKEWNPLTYCQRSAVFNDRLRPQIAAVLANNQAIRARVQSRRAADDAKRKYYDAKLQ